ncbi:3TM-type holin [Alkalilimnicola sp. S0819]|uniref:3TM-type holin n=1 Tax=Alkalilimnicola sp. S0819 TaxID=2613922 RepID=UPI001261589F|nr:3TM-type holin [Alkalilimnicola sp. S0819]KAB7624339.1 hypothetical protein F3N43_05895 [Alkalilimnicola sp. S0819]MPQ16164.1 hypothetical protein [Alkalilimnicola sp. S0819]
MDWKDVKAGIGRIAPVLGAAIGGPTGGAVGTLVASALGVDDSPEAVQRAVERDPEAALKLKQLEQEHARELRRMVLEAEAVHLAQINETIRTEAAADDAYVRRWRPTYGYATALTWVLQSLAIVAAIVGAAFVYPEHAGEILNGLSVLMGAMVTMWSIALAVLGVSVRQRSRDKQVQAGQAPDGIFDALAQRLGRGGEKENRGAE